MVTGRSIATLVLFILSMFFVIRPVTIKRVPINLLTAPIVTIAILWASGCLGPKEIRDGIVGTEGVKPYNILLLFFSLAYMAISLDLTGVLQSAAFAVANKGGTSGRKTYVMFYGMLTCFSMILGNDPVILSGTVFLVYYTKVAELSPTAWLLAEFAAANTASMVLFVGNPTNVVVCEGFQVNNAGFTAYTILPFLACNVACFIALAVQFRSSRYLPRKLHSMHLDPRSVLLDPIGAIVGTVLLITCLVVIIVVSFFGIDVWEISVPFALAKLLCDLAWDHWRYKHDKIPVKPSAQLSDDPRENPVLSQLEHQVGQQEHELEDLTPESKNRGIASSSRDTTLVENGRSLRRRIMPAKLQTAIPRSQDHLKRHFPTITSAFPRLPFALVPFAFSQFILIEALDHQGWIDIFAGWLVHATRREMYPVVWVIGIIGVILCNVSGTNIGATILLTKVARAASLPNHSFRAAAIALAVASNIGAVSFTFSASLAGLLWRQILRQKGIIVTQRTFAYWNVLPILLMTAVGLAVVSAEMAVLYRGQTDFGGNTFNT